MEANEKLPESEKCWEANESGHCDREGLGKGGLVPLVRMLLQDERLL